MALKATQNMGAKLNTIGYISTGRQVTKTKENGQTTTYPEQVSWFVLPDDLVKFMEDHNLPAEPKVLQSVFVTSDDPDKCFPTRYEQWIRGTLVCYGDDVCGVATRKIFEQGRLKEEIQVQCLGEECPLRQQDKCKPAGRLYVIIPNYPSLGVFCIQTRGWSSIRSILEGLQGIKMLTQGRLVNIPLNLRVKPFEATVNGQPMERYKIVPEAAINYAELQVILNRDKPVAALMGTQSVDTREIVDPEAGGDPAQAPVAGPVAPPTHDVDEDDVPAGMGAGVTDAEFREENAPVGEPPPLNDPFEDGTGNPGNKGPLKLGKNMGKVLDDMRKEAGVSDAKWLKAMKTLYGENVTKTSDIPQKMPTENGEVDTIGYWKKYFADSSGKANKPAPPAAAPAAPEVPEVSNEDRECDGCHRPESEVGALTLVDGELYCSGCMALGDSFSSVVPTNE